MLSMSINQFANVLSFVWALFDNLTVVLKEMVYKEFVEFFWWARIVIIDFASKNFAENQSIGKTSLNGWKLSQKHQQISIENSNFIWALI